MQKLDVECPEYAWVKNKGYPTKQHVEAVLKHGMTAYHRTSFHVKALQLKFDF